MLIPNLELSEYITWSDVNSATLGLNLYDIEDEGIQVKPTIEMVPQRPGGFIINTPGDLSAYSTRSITLFFKFIEEDYILAKQKIQAIRSAFSPDKGTNDLVFSTDPTKSFRATSAGNIKFVRRNNRSRIWDFEVGFNCYDPFMYESADNYFDDFVTNGQEITNDGDFWSDNTTYFTTDDVGDVELWWNSETKLIIKGLTSGQEIRIMSHYDRVWIDDVISNTMAGVSYNANQNFMRVPKGVNTINWAGPIDPATVKIRFRRRWE